MGQDSDPDIIDLKHLSVLHDRIGILSHKKQAGALSFKRPPSCVTVHTRLSEYLFGWSGHLHSAGSRSDLNRALIATAATDFAATIAGIVAAAHEAGNQSDCDQRHELTHERGILPKGRIACWWMIHHPPDDFDDALLASSSSATCLIEKTDNPGREPVKPCRFRRAYLL